MYVSCGNCVYLYLNAMQAYVCELAVFALCCVHILQSCDVFESLNECLRVSTSQPHSA